MSQYVLATRPWSFTAAMVPIAVTAAVCEVPIWSEVFLRAMLMGITVQAGANLTNTYYDFLNGVDNQDVGEKTLVEEKISRFEALTLSISCYILGFLAIFPYLRATLNFQLPLIFIAGILLAYFYTANPVGLKYKALGDVTIFLTFGPLLMQCCSLLFTGSMNQSLLFYSIPIGLMTEQILHANNARDRESDMKSGFITLATILGENWTYYLFVAIFAGSYLSVAYIGLFHHWGCLASCLTIPLALGVDSNYRNKAMAHIDAEVAQVHLPFGILMILGIIFTERGLSEVLSTGAVIPALFFAALGYFLLNGKTKKE